MNVNLQVFGDQGRFNEKTCWTGSILMGVYLDSDHNHPSIQ